MDTTRFDAIARRLSASDSRRGVVTRLAAAGLGLGLMPRDDARAKNKKKRCRKRKQTCGGSNAKCCGSLVCQDVPGCGPPDAPGGAYCCSKPQGSCASACDCCDFGQCVEGTCCAIPDDPCDADADCCEGLVCNGLVCVIP